VVDVTAQVEGQGLLQAADAAERVVVTSLGQLLERRVDALHVGGVVLVVVQFHDLAGNVWLESAVVVGEIWKNVFRHGCLSVRE
jgi:hypothetical protein